MKQKNLNRQVKNNIKKFLGEDFMFELTDEEVEELSRCKNFTLKDEENGRGKNIKYNPHAKDGVKIRVYSDNLMKGLSAIEYTDFRKQYTGLDIELYESGGVFHDRYIILDYGLDSEKIYLCGASSKDSGARITTILEDRDKDKYKDIINEDLACSQATSI